MILIIDNYDSFVYNLAQYVGELGGEPVVYRNTAITISNVEQLNPSHIIISPGPRTPDDAGISNEIIRVFSGKIPILGVCLGHQCIGQVYCGIVTRATMPTHGKSSLIYHDGKTIYRGLSNPFEGGRYHSLVIENRGFSPLYEVSSRTADGTIMGIRHIKYAVEGVQFHPESIMTGVGHRLLDNFLRIKKPHWEDE